jgi:hypothetical protein
MPLSAANSMMVRLVVEIGWWYSFMAVCSPVQGRSGVERNER